MHAFGKLLARLFWRRGCMLPVIVLGAVLLTVAGALAPGPGLAAAPTTASVRHWPGGHAANPASAGPFVTLLFSRTEMTAADGCVRDDVGIAGLGTAVAPYLRSLGMAGTGTLVTGKIDGTTLTCAHYGDSLMGSWHDAFTLARDYGWSFVSHTATYPRDVGNLPPRRAYAETCGSAAAIDAHGLPGGHGLIAYPGAQPPPEALQAKYGARCFDWGRRYGNLGLTMSKAASAPPYWQYTMAFRGGPCQAAGAPCYTIHAQGSKRYANPASIIAQIHSLRPGQWLTLQSYILVTGRSPAYTQNRTRWDCSSPNPALHWTNDVERYCYSDFQQILKAIAATPGITVTDPLTVGKAFGRTIPHPPAHAAAPAVRHVVLLDMENHTLENLFGFPCAQGALRNCPASVAMPPSVTLADGVKVKPSVLPDTIPNIPHTPSVENLGLHNEWDQIRACSATKVPPYPCIGGYTASQEPNMISLARRFAWSSMTFGPVTASWGSHLFTAASTLDGFSGGNPTQHRRPLQGARWACSGNELVTWGPHNQYVPTCVPDYQLGLPNGGAWDPTPVRYVKTIFDELDAAGDSWRIYGAGLPGGGFDPAAGGSIWSVCPSFAECLDTRQVSNLVPTGQFFTDAANGHLPAYSIVTPAAGYSGDSEHNKQSMTAGDNFLGKVASAVMGSPQWASTVFLITWDDFGGFWGSPKPAPGTNPDGTPQGFRLPVLIISPFARPGYVDSARASQASITALVEQVFGLPALGANDRAAYTYGNALCLPPGCAQPLTRPVKMITRSLPASARHLGTAGDYAVS